MKVFAVAFSIEGDTTIMRGDALEHQGDLWLVVDWLSNQSAGFAKPRRLIALAPFQVHRFPHVTQFGHASVGYPIPRGLLAFPIPAPLAGKFSVLDEPDIEVPLSEVQTTAR